MSWKKQLEELRKREALAEKMGGDEKVARQHARGKLDARERLRQLLDENSFREIGKIAGRGEYNENGELTDFSASNFIFGRGRINGDPIVASADDFTVRGGASDAAIYQKFITAEKMAGDLRIPLIRMIDGTGGGGSVKSIADMGFTYVPFVPGWEQVNENLKKVPVVALALGPTAGLGAARAVASHYSIMVRGLSQIFTAGPAVVTGVNADEILNKEQLGGAEIHTRNGVIDEEADSEAHAFALARQFLSYLPSSVDALPKRHDCNDPINRRDEHLLSAVPTDRTQTYSMRKIMSSVFDQDSIFEMGKRWGRAVITAFARLDGWPVAVLASDPSFLAGSWTADTADKARRFVELANRFSLPLVHLVDNPGFMIGLEAERAATIRRGVDAMNTIYDADTPWATVIIRKAFGIAGSAMSNHTRYQYRFAWPSGDWGSLPIDGGVEVAYKSELESASDPAAALARIKQNLTAATSPFRTAEQFLIEDIIDPRETRPLLCEFAELAQRRFAK